MHARSVSLNSHYIRIYISCIKSVTACPARRTPKPQSHVSPVSGLRVYVRIQCMPSPLSGQWVALHRVCTYSSFGQMPTQPCNLSLPFARISLRTQCQRLLARCRGELCEWASSTVPRECLCLYVVIDLTLVHVVRPAAEFSAGEMCCYLQTAELA